MLMFINQFTTTALTVNGVLAIVFFSMISALVFVWVYFSKKEDLK